MANITFKFFNKISSKSCEAQSYFKGCGALVDILLSWGRDEESRVRWSGCSTITCVIQDSQSKRSGGEDAGGYGDDVKTAQEANETSQENHVSQDGTREGTRARSGATSETSNHLDQLGVIHLANAGTNHG